MSPHADYDKAPAKVVYVAPSGADFTTIQAALDANAVENLTVLVAGGEYADDTLNFTADYQTVKGQGNSWSTFITADDANICDVGSFYYCRIENIGFQLTAPTTNKYIISVNSGWVDIDSCAFLLQNGTCATADQPVVLKIVNVGVVEMSHCIVYAFNDVSDGGGATAKKAVITVGSSCWLKIRDTEIQSLCSGQSAFSSIIQANASTSSIDLYSNYFLHYDDDGTLPTLIYSTVTTNIYALGNHLAVTSGSGNDIYCIYSNGGSSNFVLTGNQIQIAEDLGGAEYLSTISVNNDFTSSGDSIAAADGWIGAGDYSICSNTSFGDFTVSDNCKAATFEGDVGSVGTILGSSETLDAFIEDTTQNGVLDAFSITDEGGLNIQWSAGEVYIDGKIIDVDARGTNLALTDDDTNYLYALVSTGATMQVSTTEPTEAGLGEAFAHVATIYTYSGDIEYLFEELVSSHLKEAQHEMLNDLHGEIVSAGLKINIDTDGTNANDFTAEAGAYYLHGVEKTTVASTLYSAGVGHGESLIKRYFHTAGAWDSEAANGVDFDNWDDGTNKDTDANGKWYTAWIFIEGNGSIEYVYPQVEHASQAAALTEGIVYPPLHEGYVIPLAKFVFRGGAAAFDTNSYFVDIRPFHGASNATSRGVQNIWATITSDAGSATADTSIDTLTIAGQANQLETSIAGDTLTINLHADVLGVLGDVATNTTAIGLNTTFRTDYDVLTTRGDLMYVDDTGIDRLPIGADTFVLTSDGTDAAWAAAAGGVDAANGVDNRIATFSDADSLNGEANFTFDGTKLLLTGSMYMVEQAAAGADTASHGQFWVSNDAPCLPMFTGDTGIDYDLTVGLGGFNPDVDAFNIGSDAVSSGADSIALGHDSSASGGQSISIGRLSDATATSSIAIGYITQSIANYTIAIGHTAEADAQDAIAIGRAANPTDVNAICIGVATAATDNHGISIGTSAATSSNYSIAIGYQAVGASGSTALGQQAGATGTGAVSIGRGSDATQTNTVAVGSGCIVTGTYSHAMASSTNISGSNCMVFGYNLGTIAKNNITIVGNSSTATGTGCTSIGYSSDTGGAGETSYNVAIGYQANADAGGGVSIGYTSGATSTDTIAVGSNSIASSLNAIALGHHAEATGSHAISIGYQTDCTANYAISIGYQTEASIQDGIAIGRDSEASTANYCIAIGYAAIATHLNSVALGTLATTTVANQVMLGTATETVYCPGGLVVPIAAAPVAAVEGSFYVDTDASANGDLMVYSNAAWRTVATL